MRAALRKLILSSPSKLLSKGEVGISWFVVFHEASIVVGGMSFVENDLSRTI